MSRLRSCWRRRGGPRVLQSLMGIQSLSGVQTGMDRRGRGGTSIVPGVPWYVQVGEGKYMYHVY